MKIKAIPAIFESDKPNPIDRFLEKTFLRIVPDWIQPNHLTIFRYATVPPLVLLLVLKHNLVALILFIFSAFSDLFDGAMARTRNSITEWGKLNDPIADKLLVGSVGFLLITRYIGLAMMLIILGIEAIILIFAFYKKVRKKSITSALFPGKIKMVLQSIALGLLFLYSVWPLASLLILAEGLLCLSIFFALISLLVYGSI